MGVRDLLDRQAAETVRCRIDLTCATVVALDDPGFHHGVPADTRDRPAEGHRVDRILDLALGPASSKPDRYANAPRTGLELGGVT